MPPRNLLLCFDAFGTLFKPRHPIAQQYGEVARSLGLTGFTNEAVNDSFKAAFKAESKRNPNYGKQNGLNAEKWWSRIIVNTFSPLVNQNEKLPQELVPRLLRRFRSEEAYVLFPDVLPLMRRIRYAYEAEGTRVVVGVITNSDDRVPDILTSLGLRVSPLQFPAGERCEDGQGYDVEFSVMSYDVGHEKPDKRIFEAAEWMLGTIFEGGRFDARDWRKVYVGDEYQKDVVGAVEAGWNAVLIEREGQGERDGVKRVGREVAGTLSELFEAQEAVGLQSLEQLAEWLPGKV